MKTGKEIKQILIEKGLKQNWLSKQIGLNAPLLSRWLNGKGLISQSKVYRIYQILEIGE